MTLVIGMESECTQIVNKFRNYVVQFPRESSHFIVHGVSFKFINFSQPCTSDSQIVLFDSEYTGFDLRNLFEVVGM